MKKFIVSLAINILLPFLSDGQSFSPHVICASGGFYTSSVGMLSATVAEMTMVQTYSSPANILTQGFQQAEDNIVKVLEPSTHTNDLVVYPNPTNGEFTLSLFGNGNESIEIKLYDLLGQIVMARNIVPFYGQNTFMFDIRSFQQGIYMLSVNRSNTEVKNKTLFTKITLTY